MKGPATLQRLTLYLNTLVLSIPDVTVVREPGIVILKNHAVKLALAPAYMPGRQGPRGICAWTLDRWGKFEEPLGLVVHDDINPQSWKLPHFIQRLLGFFPWRMLMRLVLEGDLRDCDGPACPDLGEMLVGDKVYCFRHYVQQSQSIGSTKRMEGLGALFG